MSIQSGNYYFNQFTKSIFLLYCAKDFCGVKAIPTNSAVIMAASGCIEKFFTIENESIFLAGQRLKEHVIAHHTEGKIPKPVVQYIHALLGRYVTLHAAHLQEVTCAILESVPADYSKKEILYHKLNQTTYQSSPAESYSELCWRVWDNFNKDPNEHKLVSRNSIFDLLKIAYFGRWGHTFSPEFKDELLKKMDRIFFSIPKEVMYYSFGDYSLDPKVTPLDPKVTMPLFEEHQHQLIEKLKDHSQMEKARYRLVCKMWNDAFRKEKNRSRMLAQSLFECLNNVSGMDRFYYGCGFSYPLTNLVLCLEQYAITNSLDTCITLEQCCEFESKFSPTAQGGSQSCGRWPNFYSTGCPPQPLKTIFGVAQYDFAVLTQHGESIENVLMKRMEFTETSVMERDSACFDSQVQFLKLVGVLEGVSKFLDSILGVYKL